MVFHDESLVSVQMNAIGGKMFSVRRIIQKGVTATNQAELAARKTQAKAHEGTATGKANCKTAPGRRTDASTLCHRVRNKKSEAR